MRIANQACQYECTEQVPASASASLQRGCSSGRSLARRLKRLTQKLGALKAPLGAVTWAGQGPPTSTIFAPTPLTNELSPPPACLPLFVGNLDTALPSISPQRIREPAGSSTSITVCRCHNLPVQARLLKILEQPVSLGAFCLSCSTLSFPFPPYTFPEAPQIILRYASPSLWLPATFSAV